MRQDNPPELLIAMYIPETADGVPSFDWRFVLPVVDDLDTLNEEYLVAYSHYMNDLREGMPRDYLRFRLLGTPTVIQRFQEIEPGLVRELRYMKDEDDFSFDGLAKVYGISREEMMEVFELWDKVARLKIGLIRLWQTGEGTSWMEGTHYALNTLGLCGSQKINHPSGPFKYAEELSYRNRNFPPRNPSSVKPSDP